MRRRAAVVAAIAGVAVAGAFGAASYADGSGGPSASGIDAQPWRAQLNTRVPAAIKRFRVSGAIVGVWQDGKPTYLRAFGVSDTRTRAPMRTDFHMRIGSLTKTFTVTGILQLVKEGKVSLDDPIGKYVKGVPQGNVITLRQLAEMRSGLGDCSTVIVPDLYKHPRKQWTTREVLDITFRQPMRFKPGTRFDYNNSNTVLLGEVLEKVSGMSRREYIKRRIIDPMGLRNTSIPTAAAIPNPHPRGYGDWNPRERVEDVTHWNLTWAGAAGDMISTARDIAKWTRALARGALITPELQRERERAFPAPTEGLGARYGLAYEIHPTGWRGHNGRIPGFTTFPYYLPAEKTTIVVLINSSAGVLGSWRFFETVVRTVTSDHPFSKPPTE